MTGKKALDPQLIELLEKGYCSFETLNVYMQRWGFIASTISQNKFQMTLLMEFNENTFYVQGGLNQNAVNRVILVAEIYTTKK